MLKISTVIIIRKQRKYLVGQKWFWEHLFWFAQFGYQSFLSFHLLTEPGFGTDNHPGMAMRHNFPSSIGWDLNLSIICQVCYL